MAHSENGETARILREIWNEMKALNGRVDRTNAGLAELRCEVKELRGEVKELRGDVQRLDGRVENLLLGTHAREHQDFRERISRLEVTAGIAPRPGP
jgi:predicted RNase H-like nuclease (RuvC/YqgF family)